MLESEYHGQPFRGLPVAAVPVSASGLNSLLVLGQS